MSVKANENVESVVSEETVSEETANVETESTDTESAPEEMVPAKPSPEEMFNALDEANPVKGMVNLARTQLSVSLAAIKQDSDRLANDSVETEIDNLTESATDSAIVELRDSRDEIEAELERINAEIREAVLAANPDLHPMTDSEKSEFEKSLAAKKAAHKSTLTAMEKAISLTLGNEDGKYILSDLAVKAGRGGGTGSGTSKPRFESASIEFDGKTVEIPGDVSTVKNDDGSEKVNLSSTHIARAINDACGFTAIGNMIKPSEITDALVAGGYNGSDSLGIDFPVEGANKTFKVLVTPKK